MRKLLLGVLLFGVVAAAAAVLVGLIRLVAEVNGALNHPPR